MAVILCSTLTKTSPTAPFNKEKENLFNNKFSSVPREGLEPSRPCEQQILSLPCLPFHHQGRCRTLRLKVRSDEPRALLKSGAKVLTFFNMAKKSFANHIKRCIFALEIKG